MKQHITVDEMARQLSADEDTGFTKLGARALAEFLDDNKEDDDVFNIIGIRTLYSEYKSPIDFAEQQFGEYWRNTLSVGVNANLEETNDLIKTAIEECTCYIEFEGGIIVENF